MTPCIQTGYIDLKVRRKVLRRNKDEVSAEEEGFLESLMRFMKTRKTPIDRIPSLGFKQSKSGNMELLSTVII